MSDAYRDSNYVPTLIASSNVDGKTPVRLYADPITHRLLVDLPSGSGTVTSVSVVSANGFAGTVATATTTPTITLTTTITGILKGNGTAVSAASDGTDYLSSTTGITVNQTVGQTLGSTGSRLTKLWATDVTVTNTITGSISGNAATVTTNANLTGAVTSVGNATSLGSFTSANLATALTDETGTGAAVFAGSPTLTGILTVPQIVNTPLAATVTSNAATITRASRINNFTNSSAATMAITLSTSGALDGDLLLVRVYDFSGVAQTIGWTNTENSTATVPTTSNGSTTLPLTIGFQYNSATSKWRCVASA